MTVLPSPLGGCEDDEHKGTLGAPHAKCVLGPTATHAPDAS